MDLNENGEGSGHTKPKPQAQDLDIIPPDPGQHPPPKKPASCFPALRMKGRLVFVFLFGLGEATKFPNREVGCKNATHKYNSYTQKRMRPATANDAHDRNERGHNDTSINKPTDLLYLLPTCF